MPYIDKVWLSVIESAQRSKSPQEAYLMHRIPKLTTYKGFTTSGSPLAYHQATPPEDKENYNMIPATTQTSLASYIPIQSITRVRAGQIKKIKRKKYKNKNLTNFGYKYCNGGSSREAAATAASSALIA